MQYAGYNVGRVRNREFADHVSSLVEGKHKKRKFGSLRMESTSVFSYSMHLAEVDLKHKAILYNKRAVSYSCTTTVHLGAVLGVSYLLQGWKILGVADDQMFDSYLNVLQSKWGKKVGPKNVNYFLSFNELLLKYNKHKNIKTDPEVTMKEFVKKTRPEQEAMYAIYELVCSST